MLAQPRGDAGRGHVLIGIEPPVDLVAHLQRIAPVDQHRGCGRKGRVGQHYRGSGRTAEPGQPGEPLGIAADVFAHVLVRDRDHETIEPPRAQFLAQGIEAGFVGVHQHGSGIRALRGVMAGNISLAGREGKRGR
jgi:hypothetical protein